MKSIPASTSRAVSSRAEVSSSMMASHRHGAGGSAGPSRIVPAPKKRGQPSRPFLKVRNTSSGLKLPVSRTVVTPWRSRVAMNWSAREVGSSTCRKELSASTPTWTWQSIRPGITVEPDMSTTSAPEGTSMSPLRNTASIRSPSMSTTASSIGTLPVPSITVPPTSAVTAIFPPFSCPIFLSNLVVDRPLTLSVFGASWSVCETAWCVLAVVSRRGVSLP